MSELREMFPGRAFYLFSRKTPASEGVLAPLVIRADGSEGTSVRNSTGN
jgi:hypothetical protein